MNEQTVVSKPMSRGSDSHSRWVHRLSVLLTISIFPLIWVGGLVTTYDAGMAVPDWPGTYGWNMFAYPPSTWLFGPFDLLVEHSHRLLGALAGFITIGLLLTALAVDNRGWFKAWCVFLLFAVIAQGVLGGIRVRLDQRTFAMIHGCTGPLFFALATATAVMSSRWWRMGTRSSTDNSPGTSEGASRWMALVATLLMVSAYGQLILGAMVRHFTTTTSPGRFMGFVHGHLGMAAIVFVLATLLVGGFLLGRGRISVLWGPILAILLAVIVQITLGFSTWIVNYALPWQDLTPWLAEYSIQAKGFWESLIVTAHVATGSLIISLSVVACLRAWRSRRLVSVEQLGGPLVAGAQ